MELKDETPKTTETIGEVIEGFNKNKLSSIDEEESTAPKLIFEKPKIPTSSELGEYEEMANRLITPQIERDDLIRSLQIYRGRVRQSKQLRNYPEEASILANVKRLEKELKPRLGIFLENLYRKNSLFKQAVRSRTTMWQKIMRETIVNDWNVLSKGGVISEERYDDKGKIKVRHIFAPEFVDLMDEQKLKEIAEDVGEIAGPSNKETSIENISPEGKGPRSMLAKYGGGEGVRKARRIHEIANILAPTPDLSDDAPIGNTTAGKLRQEMVELQQNS